MTDFFIDLRRSLGDSNSHKYSQGDLTTVAYKVFNKLNKKFYINKAIEYIKILPNKTKYSLPTDCLDVYSYKQASRPIMADNSLKADYDVYGESTINLDSIVYDRDISTTFTAYPRLTEPALEYVIIDDTAQQTEPDFNAADVVIYKDNVYFLFYNGSELVIPDSYVSTEVAYDILEVVYVKAFAKTPNLASLIIPDQYYDAAMYLTASILLSDDNRNDVRTKAAEFHQRYSAEVQTLNASTRGTFNPANFEVPYRKVL